RNDSLQGWWPLSFNFRLFYSPSRGDLRIPAFDLDYGNQTSYFPRPNTGRTFGTISAWHRDFGNGVALGRPGRHVQWAPLAGSYSAWCGLRQHNDPVLAPVADTYAAELKDPLTNNYYNAETALYNIVALGS